MNTVCREDVGLSVPDRKGNHTGTIVNRRYDWKMSAVVWYSNSFPDQLSFNIFLKTNLWKSTNIRTTRLDMPKFVSYARELSSLVHKTCFILLLYVVIQVFVDFLKPQPTKEGQTWVFFDIWRLTFCLDAFWSNNLNRTKTDKFNLLIYEKERKLQLATFPKHMCSAPITNTWPKNYHFLLLLKQIDKMNSPRQLHHQIY